MHSYSAVTLIGTVSADKPEMKPYGFIKGDMIYSSAIPTDVEKAFLSMTARHSRVGLKRSADVGEVNVGGQVEIDFFSNMNDANTWRVAPGSCVQASLSAIFYMSRWTYRRPRLSTSRQQRDRQLRQ